METVGWCMAIIAFIWVIMLNSKVSSIERKLKEVGIGAVDKKPLLTMLKPGQRVEVEFEDGETPIALAGETCMVEDADEAWVLLRTCKKNKKDKTGKKDKPDKQYLVRLDAICSVKAK